MYFRNVCKQCKYIIKQFSGKKRHAGCSRGLGTSVSQVKKISLTKIFHCQRHSSYAVDVGKGKEVWCSVI
jgi:hypothetical protein